MFYMHRVLLQYHLIKFYEYVGTGLLAFAVKDSVTKVFNICPHPSA